MLPLMVSANTITGAEYFFDIDPGEGMGIPLLSKDGAFDSKNEEIEQEIELTDLSVGPHVLFVRMKDENNVWSYAQNSIVIVTGQKTIQAAQYAIENETGISDWYSLTALDGQFDAEQENILPIELDTLSMSPGGYTLYVRMQDSDLIWGSPKRHVFEIRESGFLMQAEYFIDEDPGIGNGFPLTALDGNFDSVQEDLIDKIDSANLDEGMYTLYVRGRDSGGNWSETLGVTNFTVFTMTIGQNIPITWDPKDIPGNVKITLSRKNGNYGSFETIVSSTENDGLYDWQVTGPPAEKCVIKIIPLARQSESVILDPFTISNLLYRIVPTPAKGREEFDLSFVGERTFSGSEQFDVTWDLWNSSNASLNGNHLIADETGCVDVIGTYQQKEYIKKIYMIHSDDENNLEHYVLPREPNDAITRAYPVKRECFHFTNNLSYDAGADYYSISLNTDAMIEFNYFTQSLTADTDITILNAQQDIIASAASMDGQDRSIVVGLTSGTYYIKLAATSGGDLNEDYYTILYKHISNLPQISEQNTIYLNSQITDQILNRNDSKTYTFTLEKSKQAIIHFIPSTLFGDYQIQVTKDGIPKDNVQSINGMSASFDNIVGEGTYTIKISSLNDCDAVRPYKLYLKESESLKEIELNNSDHSATLVRLSERMSGHSDDSEDVDFYELEIDTPTFMEMYFESQQNGIAYDISIYKDKHANENLINGIQMTDQPFIVFPIGLNVGRYFIKIAPLQIDSNEENLYVFAFSPVQETHIEIEPNNTSKFANTIQGNKTVKGRIFSETDIDYFGFKLNQNALIQIDFKPSSDMADYQISLIDQKYSPIKRTSLNGEPISIKIPKLEGEYYIKITKNDDDSDIDPYSDYELLIQAGDNVEIEGLISLVNIAIDLPKNKLAIGESVPITVVAHYSDSSSAPINSAILSSMNQNIASIDNNSYIKGVDGGYTYIVANFGHLFCKALITVGNPEGEVLQNHGSFILVAGGGFDENDSLLKTTQYLTDYAYSVFKKRLFTDSDIFYLNPVVFHDLDGDDLDDNIVDEDNPTLSNLEDAICSWAPNQKTDGPLYIYLADHGGIDSFMLNKSIYLEADTFAEYLDAFQGIVDRPVIVIIETCKSGSFIDNLKSETYERVVITSSDHSDSYQQLSGEISFSRFFFDFLLKGDSLYFAWKKTLDYFQGIGTPYSRMHPSISETTNQYADSIQVAGDFTIADIFSDFIEKSPSRSINANSAQEIYVKLSSIDGIDSVWAMIQSPDYLIPETTGNYEIPEVTVPVVTLEDDNNNMHFKGMYSNFKYNGIYRIVFFANSNKGHISVSALTYFAVRNGMNLQANYPKGDINVDGQVSLLDCSLALQYASGIRDIPVYPDAFLNGDVNQSLAQAIFILNILSEK